MVSGHKRWYVFWIAASSIFVGGCGPKRNTKVVHDRSVAKIATGSTLGAVTVGLVATPFAFTGGYYLPAFVLVGVYTWPFAFITAPIAGILIAKGIKSHKTAKQIKRQIEAEEQSLSSGTL